MIDRSFLTRHERGVLIGALRDYEKRQGDKARTAAKADTRAHSTANAFVAGDLIRQLCV